MRALALLSGSLLALAATAGQTGLPPTLTQDFAVLAAAPSLTVGYTVKTGADAAMPYRLVLSRPGAFRLTTPTGFVVSDGTTVTTYTTATNRYAQEPYTDAWAMAFSHRPEVLPWAPFLLKDAAMDVETAKAGESRKVGGFDVDSVAIGLKKGPSVVLYLDRKTHVARGALLSQEGKETLLVTKEVLIGKGPASAEAFAFKAPRGRDERGSRRHLCPGQGPDRRPLHALPCRRAAPRGRQPRNLRGRDGERQGGSARRQPAREVREGRRRAPHAAGQPPEAHRRRDQGVVRLDRGGREERLTVGEAKERRPRGLGDAPQ